MNSDQHLPDIAASLPHGPSFRFLDNLVSLTPGESAEATYLIRGDEAFLEGHFPGNPIMPGVLLIEALAQLGGILVQTDPAHPPLEEIRLTAVQRAKILGAVVPGETIRIKARIASRMGNLTQIAGQVLTNELEVLRASVALSGKSSSKADE